jgi:hypothetical protein
MVGSDESALEVAIVRCESDGSGFSSRGQNGYTDEVVLRC